MRSLNSIRCVDLNTALAVDTSLKEGRYWFFFFFVHLNYLIDHVHKGLIKRTQKLFIFLLGLIWKGGFFFGWLQDWVGLPAGVKFDPTDQELIEHLEAKVKAKDMKSHPLIDEFIPTIEGEDGICYTHPEKLPGLLFLSLLFCLVFFFWFHYSM